MTIINPYLNFQGNTEEAFNFYKSVFGGEFVGGIMRFRDTPEADKLPDNEKDKVMHIALPIGNENLLMGTDFLESMDQKLESGNNFSIAISPESKEEADRLFNALSEGGEITMPLEKASWGDYFGMLTDKFGIQWMVNYSDGQSG